MVASSGSFLNSAQTKPSEFSEPRVSNKYKGRLPGFKDDSPLLDSDGSKFEAAKQIGKGQNLVKLIRIDETGKGYKKSPYKES